MEAAARNETSGVFSQEGLVASFSGSTVKIELPQVKSSGHYLAILGGLQRVFDATPEHSTWIIDVSRLRYLPLSLVSALVMYEDDLKKRGRQVRFVGLRDNLLPTAFQDGEDG